MFRQASQLFLSVTFTPLLGYAFLLFRDEVAVHRLAKMCIAEEGKLFMFVSSVTQTHKKVSLLQPIVLHSQCAKLWAGEVAELYAGDKPTSVGSDQAMEAL